MTMSYDYKREKSGDWDNLKIIAQFSPIDLPAVDENEPPPAEYMIPERGKPGGMPVRPPG